ncbi:MAG: heme exporter protein CcmD [Gammaproteobacteria bacterium]|nr:heme exporter protein CcmD [Gammaproteobacteria bacterium]
MSIAEALDMGRYSVYVWSCYGLTLFCIIVELVWLKQHRKMVWQRVCRMVRMTKRQKDEAQV